MKKLIFALIVLFAFEGLYSQENTNSVVVGPKIKFEQTTHDFGELDEGQYAKHTFTFINEGDRPLLLREVKPGCGCTASDWTKEPVQPGQSGIITAVFNSRGMAGRTFFKSISVTTNQSDNAQVVLFIKGKVISKTSGSNPPQQNQSPVIINQ